MIKITTKLLFAIILVCPFLLNAQTSASYKPGEIMVQLKSKADIDNLKREFSEEELQKISLISERFSIYLLEFNPLKTTNQSLLTKLKKHNSVVNAQNNHYIELREITEKIPDDQLFPDQYALKNTGQDGGLIDADIDATNAWDIATGGVTFFGDSIVVAIVDGGSDLACQDIDFWKNKAEIPNNGIDDDENGYIDDYNGWNAFSNNGTIPQHNHGIHVGGIAGAIGDNGIGVSGVNWHVKTLPVVGDATIESIVVKALTYVYTIREQYNQSGGEEGAFIVADNCSFGVNQGDPAEFPIWEAMYDSLGKIGILSMGATANAPWDIDSVGDIPTAFSTDYLISVTNTTKLDKLYSSAAWGDTTIDLGAPGTTIMSLFINNGYGNKTGTSMATPHVTGSVALLFSAADSSHMSYYSKHPGPAALLFKQYILSGTDPVDDLEGRTVTGGRLNVFNAINEMLYNPLPFILTKNDSVYAELLPNTTIESSLKIMNGGGDTLFYTITDNLPDWLDINPTNGFLLAGESKQIILYFNSTGMEIGMYSTTLHIATNSQAVEEISVFMNVTDQVGAIEQSKLSDITVYPNPFTDQVNFEINTVNSNHISLEITDYSGRVIYSENQIRSRKIVWNANYVSKGIYFYKITSKGGILKTGKIVRL